MFKTYFKATMGILTAIVTMATALALIYFLVILSFLLYGNMQKSDETTNKINYRDKYAQYL